MKNNNRFESKSIYIQPPSHLVRKDEFIFENVKPNKKNRLLWNHESSKEWKKNNNRNIDWTYIYWAPIFIAQSISDMLFYYHSIYTTKWKVDDSLKTKKLFYSSVVYRLIFSSISNHIQFFTLSPWWERVMGVLYREFCFVGIQWFTFDITKLNRFVLAFRLFSRFFFYNLIGIIDARSHSYVRLVSFSSLLRCFYSGNQLNLSSCEIKTLLEDVQFVSFYLLSLFGIFFFFALVCRLKLKRSCNICVHIFS